jgi:hypothetical protein
MILRNKILPIAIVAVLLGGTVGAFIAHRNSQPATTADNTTTPVSNPASTQAANQITATAGKVTDLDSYRTGFADGFLAGTDQKNATDRNAVDKTVSTTRVASNYVPTRSRSSYSRYDNTRRVYYDYNTQPRQRTFWQKHRDKLTVAMGTGGGAILGALIGGGKGAAIGSLIGGGGSALYTYKLRNRHRSY